MNTIELVIKVPDEQLQEQLIAELSDLEFEAFEQRRETLLAFVHEAAFNQHEVENLLTRQNIDYTISTIAAQNWNAVWESNFEPVRVDNFCMVRAHFHEAVTGVKFDILITPKMSFGTGHHATTYMMLSKMQELNFENKLVADFGTGTGVLAILASKMGAAKVWAIDNDDWSILNATENIANNAANVQIEKADTFASETLFDVILANINKNVLTEHAKALSDSTKQGGTLLLSGLLNTDKSTIVELYSSYGFSCNEVIEKNNWICIELIKVT